MSICGPCGVLGILLASYHGLSKMGPHSSKSFALGLNYSSGALPGTPHFPARQTRYFLARSIRLQDYYHIVTVFDLEFHSADKRRSLRKCPERLEVRYDAKMRRFVGSNTLVNPVPIRQR